MVNLYLLNFIKVYLFLSAVFVCCDSRFPPPHLDSSSDPASRAEDEFEVLGRGKNLEALVFRFFFFFFIFQCKACDN